MTPKQELWNIVLAGSWNRAIFTPDWVNRVLFNDPDLETLISILPRMPIVYRNRQVALEASGSRLVFRPRRLDDACIQAAERMAHVTLNTLQDTPIRGIGINFGFVEDELRRDLAELLDFRDDAELTGSGWAIEDRRVARRLRQGEDVLNLTFVLSGHELTIEFNFHTETTDNAVARQAVENRALRLRDTALLILNDLYQLQPAQA
jgi:hypothetical protein